MAGVKAMLDQMRSALGWGEPNEAHRWYGERNGAVFKKGSTPWCNMVITWAAHLSGNHDVVCFGTDYAYTVWHAQRFQKEGKWFPGTAANVRDAKPGDIVFFDWGGSDGIGAIDHVGIVEKNLGGGRLQTLEGNVGNRMVRKIRTAGTIAGYGRPDYKGGSPSPPRPVIVYKGHSITIPPGEPVLSKGSKGDDVGHLQRLINVVAGQNLVVDEDFGPKTKKALKALQRLVRASDDGEWGPQTRALVLALVTKAPPAPQPPSLPSERQDPAPTTPKPPSVTPGHVPPATTANKLAKQVWLSDGVVEAPEDKVKSGNLHWLPASYLYYGYKLLEDISRRLKSVEDKLNNE